MGFDVKIEITNTNDSNIFLAVRLMPTLYVGKTVTLLWWHQSLHITMFHQKYLNSDLFIF